MAKILNKRSIHLKLRYNNELWQRDFRVAYFLMFMSLCDPFPLSVDETWNTLLRKTGWLHIHDYITQSCNGGMTTLHKAVLEASLPIGLEEASYNVMRWQMERAMGQETKTLSPETFKELDSAKKPHKSGIGSFPSQVSHKTTAPVDTLTRAWQDPEAENLA